MVAPSGHLGPFFKTISEIRSDRQRERKEKSRATVRTPAYIAQLRSQSKLRFKILKKRFKTGRANALSVYSIVSSKLSPEQKRFVEKLITWPHRDADQCDRCSDEYRGMCIAISKQSPKTYISLSRCLSLPTRRQLFRIATRSHLRLNTGCDKYMFDNLRKTVLATLNANERFAFLAWHQMPISEFLEYSQGLDCIEGFVDLGPLGRKKENANHALIFMLHGLVKSFKQPLCFFFTGTSALSSSEWAGLVTLVIKKVSQTGKICACAQLYLINIMHTQESRLWAHCPTKATCIWPPYSISSEKRTRKKTPTPV